jgi:hypothetical protein
MFRVGTQKSRTMSCSGRSHRLGRAAASRRREAIAASTPGLEISAEAVTVQVVAVWP